MKPFFTLIICILTLTSCTSYQYVNLKSSAPSTVKSNHYYYETDEVYIDFSFAGSDFPIDIYIENTGNEDLYIDLERSLFIEDGAVINTFLNNQRDVYAPATGGEPHQLIIPPGTHAKMVYRVFSWKADKYYRDYGKKNLRVGNDGITRGERVYTFKEGEAPKYEVQIRLANNKEMKNEMILQFPFTPEKVITTSQPPSSYTGLGASAFHETLVKKSGGGVVSF
ncbi:MAG TPA: hypothetical protein VJ911_00225, partial [Cryomorphaceae bacterium]|nr:hypothetical protein [Cryomorphaceae bacterium]